LMSRGPGAVSRALIVACVPFLALAACAAGDRYPIGVGDSLPDLSFNARLSADDAKYLGIDQGPPVSIGAVQSELLVTELFIAQCFKCQKQAPVFEEAYTSILADSILRGKVAFMGVGIGNTQVGVDGYREAYSVTFPLLPDDSLAAFKQLGSPGKAPFTIFARRTGDGHRIVVSVHGGPFRSPEDIVDEVKATLEYDLSVIQGGGAREPEAPLESVISQKEITSLIASSADTLLGKPSKVELVKLGSGESVYEVTRKQGSEEMKLFASVVSRRTICGDCHDTHFIYTFGSDGRITDFIPISLTKIGNVQWDEEEVAFMKGRLIGRSIAEGTGLDTRVDALTGATITSILIFDSLRDGKELYNQLRAEGRIRD
jgi:hypothetical protein